MTEKCSLITVFSACSVNFVFNSLMASQDQKCSWQLLQSSEIGKFLLVFGGGGCMIHITTFKSFLV